MKKIFFITIISMLSTVSQAASSYSYKCITDTNKEIRLNYSYNYGYSLDVLTIDGQDYKQGSTLSVTRGDGIQLTVRSFKNNENLFLKINAPTGSIYQLGNGSVRTLKCENTTPAAPRKDDGI